MIDLSAFMEPRGIIKVFQFIFVICAFACTCDFRGEVVLTAECPQDVTTATATSYSTDPPTSNASVIESEDQVLERNGTVLSVSGSTMFEEEPSTSSPGPTPSSSAMEVFGSEDDALGTILEATDLPHETVQVQFRTTFQYAFKLDQLTVQDKNCNNTLVTMQLGSDYAAPSSFYVFVGVSSMLYTLMAVALYTAFKQYYEMEWVPVVDLAIHFAYTIMWFAGSIAWAVAVTSIKEEVKLSSIIASNPSICYEDVDCSMEQIKWQLLDFSIVFGFLNFVLYLANMWFIFKETTFYSKKTIS